MEIAKRYARLYGMSRYEPSSGIPNLPAAWNNVKRLRNILPTWGFTVEPTKNPQLDQIISDLEDAAEEVTGNDLFLLYLSGHSFMGRDSRDAFFATRSTSDLSRRSQSLDFREIIDRLGDIRARATILIMDTCFSGGVNHLPRTLEISPAGNTLAILSSSRLGKKSFVPEESTGEPLSIYTGAMLDNIAGYDATGIRRVTLTEFADGLYLNVAFRPKPQEPRHTIHGLGSIPLLERNDEAPPPRAYGNRWDAEPETTAWLGGLASRPVAATLQQDRHDPAIRSRFARINRAVAGYKRMDPTAMPTAERASLPDATPDPASEHGPERPPSASRPRPRS